MIRLIALDLDGTLIGPDWRVGEADSAAVAAARERGVTIVINTARWYGLALRTANYLELLVGVTMKTLSNYVNHQANTPIDEAFGG